MSEGSFHTNPLGQSSSFNRHSFGRNSCYIRPPISWCPEILLLLPWWLTGKESACQCRKHGFDPWIGKIAWKRKENSNPLQYSLLGKCHGQGSLQSIGSQRVGHNLVAKQQTKITGRVAETSQDAVTGASDSAPGFSF